MQIKHKFFTKHYLDNIKSVISWYEYIMPPPVLATLQELNASENLHKYLTHTETDINNNRKII